MSFSTYYTGILARRKPGAPTVDEARRDYLTVFPRLGPLP
jgi:hypothetical protein